MRRISTVTFGLSRVPTYQRYGLITPCVGRTTGVMMTRGLLPMMEMQRSFVTKKEELERKRRVKKQIRREVEKEDPVVQKLENAELLSQFHKQKSLAFPGPRRKKYFRVSDSVPDYIEELPDGEDTKEGRRANREITKLRFALPELQEQLQKKIHNLLQKANLSPDQFDPNITADDLDLPKDNEVYRQVHALQRQLDRLQAEARFPQEKNLDTDQLLEDNAELSDEESMGEGENEEQARRILPDSDGEERPDTRGARDLDDVDLDSYDLDSGEYIDAQTFLQDVSGFKVNDFPIEKRTRVVDMIEKARRILRKQKEDMEFWDEFLVIRQLHELSLLNEHHYRPLISPDLKDNLYHLHKTNPEEWTTAKLAQKFRIKKVKVEAILKLKIDEYFKAETAPWEVSELGDEIDDAYAEYFGYIGFDEWAVKEFDTRNDITEPRWRSALYTVADEEEDLSALHRKAFRVQEQWDEMPSRRPSSSVPDYPDGGIIRKPQYKYKKRPRSENIFIDSSPVENFEEQAKIFWVAKDGSMRYVTWPERVKIFKRGPFGDQRPWTGSPANLTALIDPVIFPADAEEEKLMSEQQKPMWKNRRFAQSVVVREQDVVNRLDAAFGGIAPQSIKKQSYLYGRIPHSVQQILKEKRSTNPLDTIYKPAQLPPF